MDNRLLGIWDPAFSHKLIRSDRYTFSAYIKINNLFKILNNEQIIEMILLYFLFETYEFEVLGLCLALFKILDELLPKNHYISLFFRYYSYFPDLFNLNSISMRGTLMLDFL